MKISLPQPCFWEQGSPAAIAANLTVVVYSSAPSLEELRVGAAGATELDVRKREVAVVDLPAGHAVRVHALRRSGPDDDSDLLIDVVEHLIPVPRTTDVLVLQGSTPCLDVGDELGATFDRIAGTLVFRSLSALPKGPDDDG